MHDGVELPREARGEVVAGALGLGEVDDPDRALQPRTGRRADGADGETGNMGPSAGKSPLMMSVRALAPPSILSLL